MVRATIDKDVANSLRMPQHGDPRVGLHILDQRLRPARYHQIDPCIELQQLRYLLTPKHQRHRLRRQVGARHRLPQNPDQGSRRSLHLLARLQQHRIAALYRQRRNLRHRIRTRLKDHRQYP